MSLESGTTLCRLNQELLPDPGRPIASTTMPFGGRCVVAAAAGTLGTAAACGTAAGSASVSPASVNSSSVAGTPGIDPFTAAGANACATACSRPRPPRPRPPRRRRPRPVELVRIGAAELSGCRASAGWSGGACSDGIRSCATERGLRPGRSSATGGGGTAASDSVLFASESALGGCSASKYAGCNGGGAGWSAGVFLRRCKRSRIHLRMQGF